MATSNFRITQRLADKLGVTVKRAAQKFTVDAATRILERSPVDKGRYRASWRFNEGSVDESVAAPGDASIPQINLTISGTQIVYISNNLPYALPLEEGHSRQAPLGVVGITLAEMEAEAESYLGGKIK